MTHCHFCGREAPMPCRSTRDMEEASETRCSVALMLAGGGEMTVNRIQAESFRDALSRPDTQSGEKFLSRMVDAGLVTVSEGVARRTPEGDLALQRANSR